MTVRLVYCIVVAHGHGMVSWWYAFQCANFSGTLTVSISLLLSHQVLSHGHGGRFHSGARLGGRQSAPCTLHTCSFLALYIAYQLFTPLSIRSWKLSFAIIKLFLLCTLPLLYITMYYYIMYLMYGCSWVTFKKLGSHNSLVSCSMWWHLAGMWATGIICYGEPSWEQSQMLLLIRTDN